MHAPHAWALPNTSLPGLTLYNICHLPLKRPIKGYQLSVVTLTSYHSAELRTWHCYQHCARSWTIVGTRQTVCWVILWFITVYITMIISQPCRCWIIFSKYLLFSFICARQHYNAIARSLLTPVRLSVCPSVCPSVCHTGGSVKDGWS